MVEDLRPGTRWMSLETEATTGITRSVQLEQRILFSNGHTNEDRIACRPRLLHVTDYKDFAGKYDRL